MVTNRLTSEVTLVATASKIPRRAYKAKSFAVAFCDEIATLPNHTAAKHLPQNTIIGSGRSPAEMLPAAMLQDPPDLSTEAL
jgi:hypothetical protein